MKKLVINISATDKNFGASLYHKDIDGVVFATGKTLEEVKQNVSEALQFHIESCLEDGDDIPEYLQQGKYEIEFDLDASALLLKVDGILTLSAISRATGINQKQLGHYRSGLKKARPQQKERIASGIKNIGKELALV